jgi:hypothetical protein
MVSAMNRAMYVPSLPTLAYAAIVTAFLAGWHAKVTGALSLAAVIVFGVLAGLCLLLGRACLARAPLDDARKTSLNLRFLVGFLAFNSLLFALCLAAPFSIVVDATIVAALTLVLGWWSTRTAERAVATSALPELLALAISAVAATLWSLDGLTPIVSDGANTIFRLWGDSFVHARFTSALAQTHGLASLSDIRLAGSPLYLYHYASYATPAALVALTGTTAFGAYASFLVPFGIMLTGIAAFALVRSWWGAWPAVAATVALVLLPDAYQQGFANRYLSYNFMQQVNIGGLYGVAGAALAWLFVIRGCRTGNLAAVLVGLVLVGLTLFYKAHVFVANAFLVLAYPCLFFAGLRPWRRVVLTCGVVVVVAIALTLSQQLERAPTIRFDGSGAAAYVARLAWNYEDGALQTYFDDVARGPLLHGWALATNGLAIVLLSTFGVWLAIGVACGFALRRRVPLAILMFPALVLANYLAMAFGLALDTKGIGSPDELLNRPLVWAYFLVVAWSGGAAFLLVFGDALPKSAAARAGLAIALVACFASPWFFGRNLQTYPRWPGFETYASANSVPTCIVKAADFLREKSAVGDVIQDSENDPRFVVTGLSERQGYVSFADNRPPPLMDDRLRELASWRQMTDAAAIRRFAAERGIAWYLLRPTTAVAWPPELLQTPVFACEGFRLYRFSR